MEVTEYDAREAEATYEEVRDAIINSCVRRECRKRAGLDKAFPISICKSHDCRLLTNDNLCMLGGNRIKKKGGRLSFEQPKGTLRMNRDKTQGMTYRKF